MSIHISAKPGEIAKGILLPGDPKRAEYIAGNYLGGAVCFNRVRGMLGFTGDYKGKKVSVMGTGMGIPSISIYATELMKDYGVENLIRVGTCGGVQDNFGIGDILVGQGACCNSDFNNHVFPGTYCPLADFNLLRGAWLKAKQKGLTAHFGNIMSGDMFYREEDFRDSRWKEYGVLGGEMEAAALYTLAKKYGARALAMVTVSDVKVGGRNMTADEREQSLGNMIGLALDTLIEFI
ncbi:purine nucleoside phosphorylase DeoD-type [Spirochaetia bacterium]|nr:purine nucleoside phosphorylase DeoD-type [Spirochaetia bacterium]